MCDASMQSSDAAAAQLERLREENAAVRAALAAHVAAGAGHASPSADDTIAAVCAALGIEPPARVPPRPRASFVRRLGDMDPDCELMVAIDAENDVVVRVGGPNGSRSVEFCTTTGGGRSPRTRLALLALMLAIERDEQNRSLACAAALPA